MLYCTFGWRPEFYKKENLLTTSVEVIRRLLLRPFKRALVILARYSEAKFFFRSYSALSVLSHPIIHPAKLHSNLPPLNSFRFISSSPQTRHPIRWIPVPFALQNYQIFNTCNHPFLDNPGIIFPKKSFSGYRGANQLDPLERAFFRFNPHSRSR